MIPARTVHSTGTLTESKPPRKTPSSQDGGAAGSSGGVKRPHSDSSTPSAEQQQPKKSRSTLMQTKMHKEAATGIKMVIIHRHHPQMILDQNQADLIEEKLTYVVDVNPEGEAPPQFLYSRFAQDILTTACANECTKAWLMRKVERLRELWEGMELKVVDFRDLPKRPRVLVRIPGNMEVTKVLSRLRIQNPGLNTADWAVMSREVVGREQMLALSIDSHSFKALDGVNFKAFWGMGRVIFRTLKDDKKNPSDESAADKSSP
jgi:hypothetical protein